MKKSAVYILWDDIEVILKCETIHGREWEHRPTTRRARWSGDTSAASIAKAKQYILDNMQDDRKNVRVEISAE